MATAPTLYWYQLDVGTYSPLYYKQLDTTVRELCVENGVTLPTANWYNWTTGTLVLTWASQIDTAVRALCVILSVTPPIESVINLTYGQFSPVYAKDLDICIRALCVANPFTGLRLVSTRGCHMYTTTTSGTNLSIEGRLRHRMCASGISAMKILFTNWYDNSTTHRETANTNAIPITAALEWDSVNTYVQALKNGTSIIIPASEKYVLTDNILATDFPGLGATYPQYELFHERIGSSLNTGTWLQGENAARVPALNTTDEFMERHIPPGGAGVLQTLGVGAMTVGTSGSSQRANYTVGFFAAGATNRALFAPGDSWMSGRNDTSDTVEGGIGFLERATMYDSSTAYATLRVSRASESAVDFIASHSQRLPMAVACTDAIFNYGINDWVIYSRTAAQVIADLKTIAGLIRPKLPVGGKICVLTLAPRTSSTDSWVTEVNQTPIPGWETFRQTVNAGLVVGSDFDAILDASTILQGSNPTVWAANMTDDGIHPVPAGHLLLATSLRSLLVSWGY